eukprot:Plantae.Rhodophyta-Purpureofilum_apyrenoidigerum.ctg24738.p1 GENE.Plantae.Rhodophyta-Purpureofilum_apyrenoidigerum.ctg24738~~Plantae.Rhodophyta-Purpureofilum_apyrenoidigerum.ctg24738.p1  ORF type:complete len:435 (+),score=67.31 Plantae.Rhodophyta-Purpureofilum_apyrenoidigerum.ctg24738:98-1402(+)
MSSTIEIDVVREEVDDDRDVPTRRPSSYLREHFEAMSPPGQHLPVFRLVLTGGPCAGKTTALAVVEERLRLRGFRVFLVPEAATMLITGGGMFQDLTNLARKKTFQATLLRTQIALEDSFTALARMCGQPSIILCDRGVMDGSAYMSRELWKDMLEENHWNEVMLRDQRYDAIVHLVTAADGARDFYSFETNRSRHEPPDEAISLDQKLRTAWVGHPHLRVIDNKTDFPEKINRVFNSVCHTVGLPQSPEVQRKFTVKGDIPRLLANVAWSQEFDVDQTMLTKTTDSTEESIRRRGNRGNYSYQYRVRKPGLHGPSVELKRGIDEREYLSLLTHADPSRKTVRIKRTCFLYEDSYYVLDSIRNIEPTLTLLRIRSEATNLIVPPFLELETEVTGRKEYSIGFLSMRVKPQRKFEYETRIIADQTGLGAPLSTSM